MSIAQIFEDFMAAVWEDNICTAAGVSKYDEYYDANKIAAALGGRQVGNYAGGENNSATVEYLFPDGSTATVILDDDRVGVGVNGTLP